MARAFRTSAVPQFRYLLHFADSFDTEHAVSCFPNGSAFVTPSCNCLGKQKPAGLESRPVVTIVAPSWLGGAVDAWLLKILIEEVLGWPVALISDLDSRFDSVPSIYQAMADGDVHIWPEASARRLRCVVFRRLTTGWMVQIWRSEDLNEYNAYVLEKQTVLLPAYALTRFGSAGRLSFGPTSPIGAGGFRRCIRGMSPVCPPSRCLSVFSDY